MLAADVQALCLSTTYINFRRCNAPHLRFTTLPCAAGCSCKIMNSLLSETTSVTLPVPKPNIAWSRASLIHILVLQTCHQDPSQFCFPSSFWSSISFKTASYQTSLHIPRLLHPIYVSGLFIYHLL